MPNTVPPVTTAAAAVAYREELLAARPAGSVWQPLVTLYLTDGTTPADIDAAHAAGVRAAKYYPAGATTNSHSGVTSVAAVTPALARMAEVGMLLLVHGETTDPAVDVFDREAVFLTTVMPAIRAAAPGLRTVLEHITTAEAVEFVLAQPPHVAATITPQHLLYNRNGESGACERTSLACCPTVPPPARPGFRSPSPQPPAAGARVVPLQPCLRVACDLTVTAYRC